MPVLITDPVYEEKIRAELENAVEKRRDEVWDGVLVVPPLANNEHQFLVTRLALALWGAVDLAAGDQVLAGCNVSDRETGWTENYREPDVAVYLRANPAKDCDTHWCGGPDLLVEVVSPGEDPRQKLGFYARVNTREVLVVDRSPWSLELYRLQGGKLEGVGRSEEANPAVLASVVLPLTFRLQSGTARPVVVVTHTATGQTWTA